MDPRFIHLCFHVSADPFPSFRFHALSPPLPFPKTETRPISTTVAPFYCPRCLSRTRNKTRGGKKRKKRKKEQLVRTAVNDNCFLSRRWIVIRNEGKQVPRLLLDRELTAAIRAIQLARVSFEARRVLEDWTVARIDSERGEGEGVQVQYVLAIPSEI